MQNLAVGLASRSFFGRFSVHKNLAANSAIGFALGLYFKVAEVCIVLHLPASQRSTWMGSTMLLVSVLEFCQNTRTKTCKLTLVVNVNDAFVWACTMELFMNTANTSTTAFGVCLTSPLSGVIPSQTSF